MRVIEPDQLKRRSIKKRRIPKLPIAVGVLVLVIGAGLWVKIRPQEVAKADRVEPAQSQVASANTITNTPKKGVLKTLTNEEFVKFYSTFVYPNTEEIHSPPPLTGDPAADLRVQQIAESRGYKLRSAPTIPPVSIDNGFMLQQKAVEPLRALIAAAKKEGHNLVVTAAFRSFQEQRDIFLPRLADAGATIDAIKAGKADDAINTVLKRAAPPGYSRHHNGFTVDLACGDVGGEAFLRTSCFVWMSKNNFEHAKQFGWIPSYPDGSTSSGPEPEPWEYVWVGVDALTQ